MGIRWWRRVTKATARGIASAAFVAQIIALAAPTIDARADASTRSVTAAVLAASSAPAISAPHGTSVPHNPTTCPACIAQSLHAQLSAAVRLPTLTVAERAPADRRTTTLGGRDPPATHQSRAPPATT